MDTAATKEAVVHVLVEEKVKSKYALAQQLGVRPIMINNYLKKTRMGWETANRFKELFGIDITDKFDNRARLPNVDKDIPK